MSAYIMTVHRWFANKACPGDYLYNLHPQIAAEVNKRLSVGTSTTTTPTVNTTETSETVRVTDKTGLNCRSGAGTSYGIVKAYPFGTVLTITKAASNGWGYTGEGWVNLAYTEKVTVQKEELDMTKKEFIKSLTGEEAYDLLNKALNFMGDWPEPGWSKEEGYWQKAVAEGVIRDDAPERLVRRDEMMVVLGRLGLL